MSKKIELFNDAIADAKALKETALSNAKLALAETFAPKVSSMISNRLNEMEEELDENFEDEKSLDEILNSLEENDEFPEEEVTDELPLGDETEDEFGTEDGIEFPEGEEVEDQQVAEITVEELKDVIRDVMQELEGSTEPEENFEPEIEDETEPTIEDEEEINLDEMLDELGQAQSTEYSAAAGGLDNLISRIKNLAAKSPQALKKIQAVLAELGAGAGAALRSEEVKQELAETKTQLSEINLLNAKLIGVNKVFRTKNLTESQKVKVINAFDRTTTLKEVKNTFETIKEAFTNSNTNKPLKENLSRASRPAGIAQNKPQILNEDTAFISRMQKLAGII